MKGIKKTLISLSLVGAMLASSPLATIKAAADSEGKYVSDVYIAYGKTEEEAAKWLTENGWEPVKGDLDSGKNSAHDDAVAAVMGIHRTSDPNDAITDMALMNMRGGYSFDMYSEIVESKKTEINAFLDSFTPALEEYRANLNGEGSEGGQKRAEMVRDLLNNFYDGEVDGEYAVNDTGKPIGELLASTTKHEYGDDKYEALPKEDKLKYGDFQQILLESTPYSVLTVEKLLCLATDSDDRTWLERLSDLQSDNFAEEAELVLDGLAPGTSESAIENLLAEKFQDTAVKLSSQWEAIHNEIVGYNELKSSRGLDQAEGESDEEYSERVEDFFRELNENDDPDLSSLTNNAAMVSILSATEYEGEWGETLYDFFMPEDGTNYTGEYEYFVRMAAALSEGQRAGLEYLPLRTLITLTTNDEAVISETYDEIDDSLKSEEGISIYSGMRREIFRDGVALTNEALTEKNKDRDPYANFFDVKGFEDIISYAMFSIGALTLIMAGVGRSMATAETAAINNAAGTVQSEALQSIEEAEIRSVHTENSMFTEEQLNELNRAGMETRLASTLMVIGGLLMVAGAAAKAYDYFKSTYMVDFTKIPLLIVDEEDIVTYKTDENGKQILDENGKPVRDINFDQFMYYDAVKCNRQLISKVSDWQNGVDKYEEWGCGDVADLNCDQGREWLALYTNKSSAKGNPILADSLKVQYGSNAMPENCTKALHKFRMTYAFNLANTSYTYNDKNNGIYVFWDEDPNAYKTAASAAGSVFNSGILALFGIGGLGLGILGTMLVMMPKRKKQEV